jgi:hypothetical protein
MRLKTEQFFKQARIKKVKIDLGAEEHKCTLEIRVALTPDVAEAFGCRDLIYAGGVPRSGVEQMKLEGGEIDCDVRLEYNDFAFQTIAESLDHYVAHMEGTGPQLAFHVKFTGYVITVADLIEHVKVDPFELTLRPNQRDLDLQEAKPASEAEGDNAERLISTEQAADTAPAADGPALPPAAAMGGTHQRGGRRKPGAPPVIDQSKPQPDPEDAEDFMKDVVPEVVN